MRSRGKCTQWMRPWACWELLRLLFMQPWWAAAPLGAIRKPNLKLLDIELQTAPRIEPPHDVTSLQTSIYSIEPEYSRVHDPGFSPDQRHGFRVQKKRKQLTVTFDSMAEKWRKRVNRRGMFSPRGLWRNRRRAGPKSKWVFFVDRHANLRETDWTNKWNCKTKQKNPTTTQTEKRTATTPSFLINETRARGAAAVAARVTEHK